MMASVSFCHFPHWCRDRFFVSPSRIFAVCKSCSVDALFYGDPLVITGTALNAILNSYFRNVAPPTALYLGLVDAQGFVSFDADDTAASHPNWSELTTYSESTRPAWSPAAAAGQQLSNATVVTFTMNSPSSVIGIFLSTVSTKGSTSGLLIGPGLLDSIQVLQSGALLKVRLVVPAVSGG